MGLLELGFGDLTWGTLIMLIIGGLLLYLGIFKNMEPLLLVPIGFGVVIVNLPLGGLMETIVDGQLYNYYIPGGQPVGVVAGRIAAKAAAPLSSFTAA